MKKLAFIIIVLLILVLGILYVNIVLSKNNKQTQYDSCIQSSKNNQAIYNNVDGDINQCIRMYIKNKGFTDDVNCMQNYNNPICKSTDRYNAEVEGNNECEKSRQTKLDQVGYNADLTIFSCAKYL